MEGISLMITKTEISDKAGYTLFYATRAPVKNYPIVSRPKGGKSPRVTGKQKEETINILEIKKIKGIALEKKYN